MNYLSIAILSIFVGSLAGLVAGFFGVGGGVIYVPGLIFYFEHSGIREAVKLSTATSLGAILITSSYSGYMHRKKGDADLREVIFIVAGGIPAAFIGARVAVILPGLYLKKFFGIVEILIAIAYMTILSRRREGNRNPPWYSLTLTGIFAGFFSGLLGIGGGIIAVPAMNILLSMPIKRSVGNSANMIFFNSLAGTISYALSKPPFVTPPITLGHINIPAALLLGISSIASVNLAVKTFVKAETSLFKTIYAFFLFIIGLRLIF